MIVLLMRFINYIIIIVIVFFCTGQKSAIFTTDIRDNETVVKTASNLIQYIEIFILDLRRQHHTFEINIFCTKREKN